MSNPQDDQFCFFKQQEENETNKNYRLKQIIPIEKFLTRRESLDPKKSLKRLPNFPRTFAFPATDSGHSLSFLAFPFKVLLDP